MDCIFCKIINKEMPSEIIYEDDKIVAIKDIHPRAPIHLLIIPKKHIEWKDKFNEKNSQLLIGIIFTAKKIAIEQNIFQACKFIFNVGKTGHINHIHLHLLGGWRKYLKKLLF